MNYKKMLRARLKVRRRSERYLGWIALNKDSSKHGHHIIGSSCGLKLNDYLIAKVSPNEHLSGKTNFEDDLINAIDNLIDYVEYLEDN